MQTIGQPKAEPITAHPITLDKEDYDLRFRAAIEAAYRAAYKMERPLSHRNRSDEASKVVKAIFDAIRLERAVTDA
jgi:hypothetical protein